MKLLIDMNLSPTWVQTFQAQAIEAIHWSMVGEPNATDKTIFAWAGKHENSGKRLILAAGDSRVLLGFARQPKRLQSP